MTRPIRRCRGFCSTRKRDCRPKGLSLDETGARDQREHRRQVLRLRDGLDRSDMARHVGRARGRLLRDARVAERASRSRRASFLSDVGYLNPIHSHAWDFDDAPLAYTAMLNGGVQGHRRAGEAGSRRRRCSCELGGGANARRRVPRRGRRASSGTGASTLFVHVGGDVGSTSSWRAGLSRLAADANDRSAVFDARQRRVHGHQRSHDGRFRLEVGEERQSARSLLHRASRVPAAQRIRRARRHDDQRPTSSGLYDGTQSGFYVQGVYQFRPRWRAGIRYDRLDASNNVAMIATRLRSQRHTTRAASAP